MVIEVVDGVVAGDATFTAEIFAWCAGTARQDEDTPQHRLHWMRCPGIRTASCTSESCAIRTGGERPDLSSRQSTWTLETHDTRMGAVARPQSWEDP